MDLLPAIEAAERALAEVSHAIEASKSEVARFSSHVDMGNHDWASTEVDKALRMLAAIRRWVEG